MFQFAFVSSLLGKPTWTSVTAQAVCPSVFTLFSVSFLSWPILPALIVSVEEVLAFHAWLIALLYFLARISGWLIICTFGSSFSKSREADALLCTGKFSRILESSVIRQSQLLILSSSNGSVFCLWRAMLFIALQMWLEVQFKHHQVKQLCGADTSSCWSKTAHASLSVSFVKFITDKVRPVHVEKLKTDLTEIWKSNV